ncbi:MAG TPA: ABC transporter ATP-binding protein [candidate division Zixibacteria bacterium]|nr:ABC transporter ATP-binding protein [candidate division Zixibacteria bacterium]
MVDQIIESNALIKEFPVGGLISRLSKNEPTKKRILNGITFDLPKGLSLALLGPNGSGKTTLLKTLSTIYSPDGGEARVCGFDIFHELKEVRKRISFVSPAMDFQKKLTLKQTLNFFVKVTNGDMALAKDFIEELQLDHLWNTKLETFSEGQKAITRLCVGLQKNPEILFADEPTNGIDFRRKQVVLDFLEKQGRERTLVLVDHDPEVVDVLCDKILLIALGGTVKGMVDVADLHSEFNYMYDIMVIPKGAISKKEAKDICPRYEMIGGMCRFFASNKKEANEIHSRIIQWGNFIDIKTSGISIEDITLLWLAKHEEEMEEELAEQRKLAKEKKQLEEEKKKSRHQKRRKDSCD